MTVSRDGIKTKHKLANTRQPRTYKAAAGSGAGVKKIGWTQQVSSVLIVFHGIDMFPVYLIHSFCIILGIGGRDTRGGSQRPRHERGEDLVDSYFQPNSISECQAVPFALVQSFTSRCQAGRVDGPGEVDIV